MNKKGRLPRSVVLAIVAVFAVAIGLLIGLLVRGCQTSSITPSEESAETVIDAVAVSITGPATGETPVITAETGGTGYTCSAVSWSPNHTVFRIDTAYTASVTLTAHENHILSRRLTAEINNREADITNINWETVTISLQFDATFSKEVTGVSIATQPAKLDYIHGSRLDLEGLVITLVYEDDETEDVTLDSFSSMNIETNPANGTALSHIAHNGNPVVVSLGRARARTANLMVRRAAPIIGEKTTTIPVGIFTMGSPDTEAGRYEDETQWQVILSGFIMERTEVTQGQYEAVMGVNPSYFKTNASEGENQKRRPVENVSWYDTLVFCNKLSILEGLTPAYRIGGKTAPDEWGPVPTGNNATWDGVEIVAGSNGYRLPTEAQWEYACRAGTTTAYNTGDTVNNDIGWYTSNSGKKTHEVGLKLPNAWGMYDMYGNVYEWCWDWYGAYPSRVQTDPMGPPSGSGRVIRGGAWNGSGQIIRSAYRGHPSPYNRVNFLGFRVLRPAQ